MDSFLVGQSYRFPRNEHCCACLLVSKLIEPTPFISAIHARAIFLDLDRAVVHGVETHLNDNLSVVVAARAIRFRRNGHDAVQVVIRLSVAQNVGQLVGDSGHFAASVSWSVTPLGNFHDTTSTSRGSVL